VFLYPSHEACIHNSVLVPSIFIVDRDLCNYEVAMTAAVAPIILIDLPFIILINK
jgi:hypothetical protein